MSKISVRKVLVQEGAENYVSVADILDRAGRPPVQIAAPGKGLHSPCSDADKQTLCLETFAGRFLKPCPGTRGYICCGYQILNVGANCPFDCTYCVLQAYFDHPSLRAYVNLEEELGRLAPILDAAPDRLFRIGTGEFTDSLALDPILRWSEILLPFFSERRNCILELKTKSDHVRHLLSTGFRDRIVVSWTLNSGSISNREEKRAPSIEKRLRAARKCQEEGFALGFHFDPLIEHADWKDGYRSTLDLLAKHIDPGRVAWISLGCFRYMPLLKEVIRRRHPGTEVLDGEFVAGLDGKMRYFKPIRIEMYAFMAEALSKWEKDIGLYLCMESDEIWRKSLGWSPRNSQTLSLYLNERVEKLFGPLHRA